MRDEYPLLIALAILVTAAVAVVWNQREPVPLDAVVLPMCDGSRYVALRPINDDWSHVFDCNTVSDLTLTIFEDDRPPLYRWTGFDEMTGGDRAFSGGPHSHEQKFFDDPTEAVAWVMGASG